MEESKRCAACGYVAAADAKFCPKCGCSQFHASTMHCPVCGMDVAPGRFCSHCGADMENPGTQVWKNCSSCGTPMHISYTNCTNCGAPKVPSVPMKSAKKRRNTRLALLLIPVVCFIIGIAVGISDSMVNAEPQLNMPHTTINWQNPATTQDKNSTNTSNPTDSTPAGPVSIPCSGLRLLVHAYTFATKGDTLQITPVVQPDNTTETVLFISSDERIATVDENGIVTAVADGEAIIYVYCGSFKVEMRVTCNVGVEPPQPTEPQPTDPQPTDPLPTVPSAVLELNRTDFTLTGYGATWRLYTGEIDVSEITFTSNDEEVATIDETGKVTAVGNGRAVITAVYLDQKVTCTVRCAGVEKPANTQYEVRAIYGPATDITLNVGETLKLQLVDKETGLRVDAAELTFTVAKEGYVTVDEEGRVKGVEPISGGVYVYIEYQGVTYKCLVRVRAAE